MVNPVDFDFHLPEGQIARYPVQPRDQSRLLVVDKHTAQIHHLRFDCLPELLNKKDCLVFNDSKVLPARLHGRMGEGAVEILLVRCLCPRSQRWTAMAKPGRKMHPGRTVAFDPSVRAHVISKNAQIVELQFELAEGIDFLSWLDTNGAIPLPPYLKRPAEAADKDTYQTVYARPLGSVAAPTAGLHFTDRLLTQVKENGTQLASVTLHVGLGTFAPLMSGTEQLHSERYEIPSTTVQALNDTRARGGRVIAVGTTTARTLETFGTTQALEGETDIFIRPGHTFAWTDGLLTNFHLPRSSLLVLVSSLLGRANTLAIYEEAIRQKYRFYSYGDAMLIL